MRKKTSRNIYMKYNVIQMTLQKHYIHIIGIDINEKNI